MQNLERKVEDVKGGSFKDWMSAKEAVAYLGITLMTLTAWSKRGLIEKRKVGGKIYLDASAVRELVGVRSGGSR